MPITPGFLLRHRYDVLTELGQGGHAIVYRGHDRELGRDVAIKVLREEILSPDLRARFTQEIQVMARLEHPHILRVHDSGTEDGQPYVVMELAPSKTLADKLTAEPQLPISDALQITRDVGSALAHAHAKGILHRDVKPDNILLGTGGALLADFGIARVTGELAISRITRTGEAVGTLQYMSPEQLCAEPVDARSDQYALACVLYEMIAGVRPHTAATFEGLRALRLTGRHAPLSVYRASAPPLLEEIVQRAMAVAPADRFRSMDELLLALDLLLTGESAGVTGNLRATGGRSGTTASAPSRSALPAAGTAFPAGMRRRPWAVGIAIAASAAAGAVVMYAGADTAGLAPFEATLALPAPANDSLSQTLAVRLREELLAWTSPIPLEKPSGVRRRTMRVSVVGDSAIVRITGVPELTYRTARATIDSAGVLPSRIVRELLANGDETALPGLHELPDRSGFALRRFAEGHRLLLRGQFDSAAIAFTAAADTVPRFAAAHFWSAQAGAWKVRSKDSRWHVHADEAVRLGRTNALDSLLTAGLHHLAHARFREACASYELARRLSARSYVAVMGQAECERRDPLVVMRNGRAVYRGSDWSALRAYRDLISIAPSSEWLAAIYPVVELVTYAQGNQLRTGKDSAGAMRVAMVNLLADTFAFAPKGITEASDPASVPTDWLPAVRFGQVIALEMAEAWTRRYPNSPDAWYHKALALELRGIGSPAYLDSAASAIDRATQLAGDLTGSALRVASAVARVRVDVRRGDFQAAVQRARAVLADSALFALPGAEGFAPLAAFIGKRDLIDRLATPDAAAVASLPSSVVASLVRVQNAMVMDDCTGARSAFDKLESQFRASVPQAQQQANEVRWITPLARLAFPCLRQSHHLPARDGMVHDAVFRALAENRLSEARGLIQSIHARRRGASSANVTWDFQHREFWMALQVGDTLMAVERMVTSLDDVSTMSSTTFANAEEAAGLRRSVELLSMIRTDGIPAPLRTRLAHWQRQHVVFTRQH